MFLILSLILSLCCSPQLLNSLMTPFSVRLYSSASYIIVTGVVSYTFLVIKPFSSRSLSSLFNILGYIPSTSLCISPNLLEDLSNDRIRASFHLPFRTYSASRTFFREPSHSTLSGRGISWISFIAQR